jgi:hypothetical protein
MLRAYSGLKQVLAEHGLTVPEPARRTQRRGQRVNLKSLYRLSNNRQPLERQDLRVAGVICEVCQVPLSELIAFEKPKARLRRLTASTQRRLDVLMAKNNEGQLSTAEQSELQNLVRQADQITLENARTLAGQRRELAGR